jgi:hypothetical protein
MYMERVYHLQVEFCEISQLLARAQKLEDRYELSQRRMEIVAEASELVYEMDAGVSLHRVPAGASSLSEVFAAASK